MREVEGNQKISWECYITATKSVHMISDRELSKVEVMAGDRVERLEKEGEGTSKPVEDLVLVKIKVHPDKVTYVGSN